MWAKSWIGVLDLHSLKLTYPLKIGLPNRKVVFQPSIFRGKLAVSFREGKVHLSKAHLGMVSHLV